MILALKKFFSQPSGHRGLGPTAPEQGGKPKPAGFSRFLFGLGFALVSLALLGGSPLPGVNAAEKETAPEEPPLVLRSLRVVGAKTLSVKEIKDELGLELPSRLPWKKPPVFKREELESDIDRLYLAYRKQGFYQVQIDAETIVRNRQVEVEIIIREGPWVRVTKIELIGARIPEADLAKIRDSAPLKVGERFTQSGYEGLKRDYLTFFLDNGHPFAKIEGRVLIDDKANTAEIYFTVDPGPRRYFGAVVIKGQKKTPEGVIRGKLTFKPGDLFSYREIYESQRRLYAMDLFQHVTLTPQEVPSEEPRLPVLLEVQERKQRTVKLGLGYGSEDQFRARVGLRWRNLAGGGRLLDLDAKYSFLESRLTGTLTNPRIFNTPLDLVLQTSLEERAYPFINGYRDQAFSTQTLLEANLPWKWRLSWGHIFGLDRPYNLPSELLPLGYTVPGRTYRTSLAVVQLRQDTTDDPVDPTTGGSITVVGHVAPKFLGSDLKFGSVVAEVRRYQGLGGSGVVLAERLKFGIIEPIQDTAAIPIFRRFYAGGAKSVRGYRLDYLGPRTPDGTPIGGTALVEGSLEARIPLYKQFRGVAFLDFGNVYPNPGHIDLGQLRYASGFGLRYQTPVGPVGLDVGFPLNPIDPKQDTYRIYLSIGQTF